MEEHSRQAHKDSETGASLTCSWNSKVTSPAGAICHGDRNEVDVKEVMGSEEAGGRWRRSLSVVRTKAFVLDEVGAHWRVLSTEMEYFDLVLQWIILADML